MLKKIFLFQNRHKTFSSNESFKRTRLVKPKKKNAVEFGNLKPVICRVTLPLHDCNPDETVEGRCDTFKAF